MAPNAVRTAISRCRAVDRASSRFATFAHHEQHERDGPEDDVHRTAHGADEDVEPRLHLNAPPGLRGEVLALDVGRGSDDVAARLLEGGTIAKPGEREEAMPVPLLLIARTHVHRPPQVDLLEPWQARVRWKHPNDGVRLLIQRDGSADDVSAPAEPCAPEVVAKHDHSAPIGADVVGGDEASRQRLEPERLKRFGAGEPAADVLGSVRRAHHEGPRARDAGHGDGRHTLSDVVDVRHRRPAPVGLLAAVDLAQRNEPVGRGEWQRTQHDAVDDAEDRGSDADRQRERGDRDRRYGAMFGERSDGEAQVGKKGAHDCLSRGEFRRFRIHSLDGRISRGVG